MSSLQPCQDSEFRHLKYKYSISVRQLGDGWQDLGECMACIQNSHNS